MIFFFDEKGTLIRGLPETIKQGSNKSLRIWLFMPISPTNFVNAYFTLPNGEVLEPIIMTKANEVPNVEYDKKVFSCWFCDLKRNVTRYAGTLKMSFEAYAEVGENEDIEDETITTESIELTVSKGVFKPLNIEKTYTYEELMSWLGNFTEEINRINKAIDDLEKIDKLNYKVVESLPQIGENNIVYLVPNTKNADSNIKDEYLWIEDKWELIGSTAIDLSDYETDTTLTQEGKPADAKATGEAIEKVRGEIVDGVTIEDTTFVREDENGGYVYKQTFSNDYTTEFTAPKGPPGPPGTAGATIKSIELIDQTTEGNVYEMTFEGGDKNDDSDDIKFEFIAPRGSGIKSIEYVVNDVNNDDKKYKIILDNGREYFVNAPKGEDGVSIHVMSLVVNKPDELPDITTINEGYGFIVKDGESYSGHSLYFKGANYENDGWTKVPNFGMGREGPQGVAGSKIVKTEFIRQDKNGNVYKQTFDNGTTNEFTAPIQPGIVSPIYRHIFWLCETTENGNVIDIAIVTIEINKSDEFTLETLRDYLVEIGNTHYSVSARKKQYTTTTPINFTITAYSNGPHIYVDGYEINDNEHTGSIGNLEYPLINKVQYVLSVNNPDDVKNAIRYSSITKIGGQDGIAIDATLKQGGQAADAKAVGEAISALTYNKVITEEYSERTTANGAEIEDGSSAKILRIIGKTKETYNLFNATRPSPVQDRLQQLTNSTFRAIGGTGVSSFGFSHISTESANTYTICAKLLNPDSKERAVFFGYSMYKNDNTISSGESDIPITNDWTILTYTADNQSNEIFVEVINRLEEGKYEDIAIMVLKGNYTIDTLPPFEDYHEQPYHAHFKKLTSTSADGTQTSTVEFENPVELPANAMIDFHSGKIISIIDGEKTEEPITVDGEYVAYNGGTETIDSGVENGVLCTLEQGYIIAKIKANPTDEATEELKKLKVGETTYSIPQGGGSSSGGISQDELDKKVDKIPGEGIIILYGRNAIGENIGYTVASSDTALQAQRIPYYRSTESTGKYTTTGGEYTIAVGTPTQPYAAANKKYVDENRGTQLYKHHITLTLIDDTIEYHYEITCLSTHSEVYSTIREIVEDINENALSSSFTLSKFDYDLENEYVVQANTYTNLRFGLDSASGMDSYFVTDNDGNTIVIEELDYNIDDTLPTYTPIPL